MGKSVRDEVLECIRELPGITSGGIVDLMPHAKRQTVYAAVNQLYIRGEITRTKEDGTYRWSIADVVQPPVRRSFRSDPAPNHVVDALRERIAELEAWKADAISRYPELAIDPLVLKARHIVADELKASNDYGQAERVLKGQCDQILPMRLVLKMLSDGVE